MFKIVFIMAMLNNGSMAIGVYQKDFVSKGTCENAREEVIKKMDESFVLHGIKIAQSACLNDDEINELTKSLEARSKSKQKI